MLDLGPDLYLHKLLHGLDLTAVDTVFITHSHSDHFAPAELTKRSTANYCTITDEQPLRLYGNTQVLRLARDGLSFEFGAPADRSVTLHLAQPYRTIQRGRLWITPLPARHDPREDCLLYLVQDSQGNALLYATDTGLLDETDARRLAQLLDGQRLGLCVMDCTFGDNANHGFPGHMSLQDNHRLMKLLLDSGCAGPDTRWYATHFSHNCGLSHSGLEQAAGADLHIAYDGLRVRLG